MTLILGCNTQANTFQVSDRRLTYVHPKTGLPVPGRAPADDESNKSIVFLAADALLVVGYSGAAWKDGLPADEWLVRRMSPPGTSTTWPHLGTVLDRLDEAVIESGREEMSVLVMGWQWNRHRVPMSVFHRIHNVGRDRQPEHTSELDRARRQLTHTFHWAKIPATPAGEAALSFVRSTVMGRLADVLKDPSTLEAIMVDGLREGARESPTIGPDCLCVRLRPTHEHQVLIRFDAANLAPAPAHLGVATPPCGFLPWIVTPSHFWPPVVASDSFILELPEITVEVQVPTAPVPAAGSPPTPSGPRLVRKSRGRLLALSRQERDPKKRTGTLPQRSEVGPHGFQRIEVLNPEGKVVAWLTKDDLADMGGGDEFEFIPGDEPLPMPPDDPSHT